MDTNYLRISFLQKLCRHAWYSAITINFLLLSLAPICAQPIGPVGSVSTPAPSGEPADEISIRREISRIETRLATTRVELEESANWSQDLSAAISRVSDSTFQFSSGLNEAFDRLKKSIEGAPGLPIPTTISVTFAISQDFDQVKRAVNDAAQILINSVDQIQRSDPRRSFGQPQAYRSRTVLGEIQETVSKIDQAFSVFYDKIFRACQWDRFVVREGLPLREGQVPTLPRDNMAKIIGDCETAVSKEALETAFVTAKGQASAVLNASKAKADIRRTTLDQQITTDETRLAQLQRNLGRKTEIGTLLIQYALPAFGVLVLALLGLPRIYNDTIQGSIFAQGLLLEVLTVFLLTSAILILGLAERIPTEALGTLLGGISGFVLGRNIALGRRSGTSPG